MLPTFVIGLREGLEAALIVGIVAAFLNQRGRQDLLKKVWFGVALAVLLCLGAGVGLHILSAELPQKEQEGLETVVGAVAVAMVTYMVIWMRRHSRDLKKHLEGATSSAMDSGSGMALVAMAFLAVLREGFETAVFLLAAFNNATNPSEAGAGAILGVAVAVVLGYGIYRGGVRLNLFKFFRFTGVVLVLVAAGLVVSALHTAHEAGWLNAGQSSTVDLTWLVRPGSVQSSLLTGMLGLQPRPVLIELIGWLVYLIPVGLYVAWPPGLSVRHRVVVRIGAPVALVAAAAAVGLSFAAPARPNLPSTTTIATTDTPGDSAGTTGSGTSGSDSGSDSGTGAESVSLQILARSGSTLSVRLGEARPSAEWRLSEAGIESQGGRRAVIYRQIDRAVGNPAGLAGTLTLTQIRTVNGGRLPLGVRADTEAVSTPVTYTTTADLTVWLDDVTGRVLGLRAAQRTAVTAALSIGATPVGVTGGTARQASTAGVTAAADRAATDERTLNHRSLVQGYRLAAILLTVCAALATSTSWLAQRRRVAAADVADPTSETAPSRV